MNAMLALTLIALGAGIVCLALEYGPDIIRWQREQTQARREQRRMR